VRRLGSDPLAACRRSLMRQQKGAETAYDDEAEKSGIEPASFHYYIVEIVEICLFVSFNLCATKF
jgi:hypothetical protein